MTRISRAYAALAAALLALALAGCSSDDSPSKGGEPTTSAPTTSAAPVEPAAPELPAAAKAKTAKGAEAFVRYWFETVSYAMETGDTGPIDAVAHKTCGACRNLRSSVDAIYGAGQHVEGGGWNISSLTLDPRSKKPSYRFAVEIDQPAQELVSGSGDTVERTKAKQFVFVAGATWDAGRFVLYGLEKLA